MCVPQARPSAGDNDTINLYRAADSSSALARGSIRSLLSWLDANGHVEHSSDRSQNVTDRGIKPDHLKTIGAVLSGKFRRSHLCNPYARFSKRFAEAPSENCQLAEI
jgi:hypothetical protein